LKKDSSITATCCPETSIIATWLFFYNRHHHRVERFAQAMMRYIHRNLVQPKWQLSSTSAGYSWSPAAYDECADLRWPFLTHFWYGEDWPPALEYW
jgi:hypothetical protein